MNLGFPIAGRWRPAHAKCPGNSEVNLRRGCWPKFQTCWALHKHTFLSKANEGAEGVSGLILCLTWQSVVLQHKHCGMHARRLWVLSVPPRCAAQQPFNAVPFFQDQSMMPEVRDLSDALPDLPMDPITGVSVVASRNRAPTGYDVVSRGVSAAFATALVLH